MKKIQCFKGFTIAELLVVISILLILSTLGFLSYVQYNAKVRDSARTSDLNNIKTTLSLFQAKQAKYPLPTDAVNITYSGATVWSQGVFGSSTQRETGKIFGELRDPKYGNQYTYSTTINQKEYLLSAVFEDEANATNILSFNTPNLDISLPKLVEQTYAADPFDPLELSPIIWLDGEDIDGDGDTGDNPSDESTITTWVNKSSAGSANNPTITDGSIKFTTSGFDSSYPGVFIDKNAGLRFDNSDITSGDIFQVLQKNDPFGGTDTNGIGLQSTTSSNVVIGHWAKYRHALRIGGSPSHYTSSPATKSGRSWPFIYGFHTDNTNYSFYDTGVFISQGATSSITGHVWGIGKAGETNGYADFVVSEILIFDTKLSPEDRQKVEGYLAHKWGQDYYLPSSHPYKDAPPESSGPPPPPDTTPDTFTLSDVTGADLSTLYTSNTIVVSGINSPAAITLSGSGQYSINGGSYTASPGTVSNADTVTVQLTSSSSSDTPVTTTLDIGGISEDYTVRTLVADTTPDSFSFSSVSDADVSTVYTSNNATISGLNVTVPISISGGDATYKISDGVPIDATGGGTATASSTYSSNSPSHGFDNNTGSNGWGNNNVLPAWLKYDFGAGNDQVITKYTLYRSSSQSGGWNSWRYSPSNWTFEGSDNNSDWTVLDTRTNESISVNATKKEYSFSNTQYYRYYRINISAADHPNDWVNITEMELITSDGGSFTAASGIVSNGDIISVRMTSSSSAGTTETGVLTVGSFSGSYAISTVGPDTIPDSFSFTDVSDASLSTQYVSDSVTVSGINTSTPISISGVGEYRISGGSYTSSPGTLTNGDVINIRQTSSASNSTTVSSTLTIGGVSATYNVTTPAPPPDTTPDSFSFTDVTDANLSTQYTSNSITVSGVNLPTPISISGGEYDVNNSKSYTASSGNIDNGDVISVRVTSSATPGNDVDATLTIGGVSDTYTVTTIPPDTTPDSFTLSDVSDAIINTTYTSNPVTVSGINTPVGITISGGGGQYSVNGGSYTSGAGTVNNGDVILVQLDGPTTWSSSTNTTLTIGGVSDTYTVTTGVGDTTPDSFVFNDVTNATLNTQYTADTITITGINTPTSISIVGGEYRIGAVGSFTSFAGTVNNGDEITVRLVSSTQGSATTSASLTVGTLSDSYNVTTENFAAASNNESNIAVSTVYVTGQYNGLIAHTYSGSTHYVIATPSIVANDLDGSTDVLDIIANKKLVYDGFDNVPSSYTGSNLVMDGGFDFTISAPVLYSGTREDLGSYGGLKQIDEGIRSTYNNFPAYQNVAQYLDDYSLTYLERIIGSSIGINPIKPFYCSDILQSKLVYNIAPDATIIASPSGFNNFGTGGIANGIKSTEGELDYEYHSAAGDATISFEWEETQKIGYVRIYNRVGCCSDRLTEANIKLYNTAGGIIYSHPLWDTTGDYVVDLDLEGIGHLHDVKKLTIESVGGNYLNIREVEIFLGGNVVDGNYKVDKDGLGGQSPYNVYCDMTTDGGGWTRIGENYITNGEFTSQNHVEEHTFTDYNNSNDNLIVSQGTQASPIYLPDAFVVQHNGTSSESYPIYIPEIPGEYFAQEIRLTAWVKDTSSSVFYNTINYTDTSSSTEQTDYEILDEVGDWQKRMARIPLTGLVDDFTWYVGENISGPFYFTGLEMEVYYR